MTGVGGEVWENSESCCDHVVSAPRVLKQIRTPRNPAIKTNSDILGSLRLTTYTAREVLGGSGAFLTDVGGQI